MIKTWLARIDEITENVNTEFSSLSEMKLNIKLEDSTWSIAQCIDHLIVTNEQYFKIIEKVNKGDYKSHWLSYFPYLPIIFGKSILRSVKPETIHKKNKTFPVFEPSSSDLPFGILARFNMMQLQLKAYLSEINPGNYKIIISSPVSNFIVYSLKDAIEIIIAHEERHFLQAKNIKQILMG